ncbi:MAG TPA: VOC family protein [Herpetosiphonaceae bacterium]
MSITIDHIVIPASDHEESARFFARVMGLSYDGPDRHFAPVRVSDTFTLLFLRAEQVQPYHFAFHVSEELVGAIAGRLAEAGIAYGNDPRDHANMRTDHPFGGQGLFFLDPDNHLIEVMTVVRPH